MTNETCRKFGAFPERLFVLHDMKVAFLCGLGPYDYDLEGLEKWLKEFREKQETSSR